MVCSKKIINGYIFYFLGQLFGGQLFELFARETNLKKQSGVQRLETPADSNFAIFFDHNSLKSFLNLRHRFKIL